MANPKHIRAVDPLRGARNPFSSGYRRVINEALETIYEIQKWREKIQGLIAERFQPTSEAGASEQTWTGLIISNDTMISPNRWRYVVQRQVPVYNGTDPEMENFEDERGEPFIINAYNRAELNNDGTGDEGYGTPVGNDGVVEVTIKPILVGAFVDISVISAENNVTDGFDPSYWFSAGNIPDVQCRK